ncbi:hypothetical protein FACS189452_10830 [Bacteroidia bacterium]|nr:hypothetical protein FACS189452_10830 [Bacteroidia bacterium]
MSQKGGVGKSSLTNSVVLDWCFKELLRTKQMPKILLIDADAQASISNLRENDFELCKLDQQGKHFQALDAGMQAAVKEMKTQFAALHQSKGWNCYDIFSIKVSDDGTQMQQALKIIESEKYDYIFIDMPGTLHQKNTAELFMCINYLIIPTVISNYGVQSTLDFCELLLNPEMQKASAIKEMRLLFNMYEIIKTSKFDEVERELTVATKIPFFKTRVKDSSFFPSKNYNSLVPPTYRINLNTGELTTTPKVTNIGELTDELRKLVSEK